MGNGCGFESSDDSSSENEVDAEGFEAEADEEASSRESSRRPLARKGEDQRLKLKETLTGRLKQREGRSTSRDSSLSKESLKITAPSKSKAPVSQPSDEKEKGNES